MMKAHILMYIHECNEFILYLSQCPVNFMSRSSTNCTLFMNAAESRSIFTSFCTCGHSIITEKDYIYPCTKMLSHFVAILLRVNEVRRGAWTDSKAGVNGPSCETSLDLGSLKPYRLQHWISHFSCDILILFASHA